MRPGRQRRSRVHSALCRGLSSHRKVPVKWWGRDSPLRGRLQCVEQQAIPSRTRLGQPRDAPRRPGTLCPCPILLEFWGKPGRLCHMGGASWSSFPPASAETSPACPPGPHVGVSLSPPFRGLFLPLHAALTVGPSGTWWAPRLLVCFPSCCFQNRGTERGRGRGAGAEPHPRGLRPQLCGHVPSPRGPGARHPQTSEGSRGCGLISRACRELSAPPLPGAPSGQALKTRSDLSPRPDSGRLLRTRP